MGEMREPYYVPQPSPYPVTVSAGLFLLALGFVLQVNRYLGGAWIMLTGAAVIVATAVAWFRRVIGENEAGVFHRWEDRSFRWGMVWFIASEVAFFLAFFGALHYVRTIAVPELGRTESLWPGFPGTWPTSGPAGQPFTPMAAIGIPAINTLILLSSGATITWAHWGLLENKRTQLAVGLLWTIGLGLVFLALQAYEYHHAYTELGLTLGAGVYGATFFMLTGFHGFHVTLGVIMLVTIFGRVVRGHFTPDNHFGFEAVAWYWHFVDVVWLALFTFVYWL